MTHDCHINHEGSSGPRETEGAVRIFNRSINKYGLRYINYIGDSSTYKKVSESKPYGDQPVGKLECVGHIQKRVGASLLNLVKETKGIGGKGIGGKGIGGKGIGGKGIGGKGIGGKGIGGKGIGGKGIGGKGIGGKGIDGKGIGGKGIGGKGIVRVKVSVVKVKAS